MDSTFTPSTTNEYTILPQKRLTDWLTDYRVRCCVDAQVVKYEFVDVLW